VGKRRFALLAALVVLLGAAAMVAIYVATEPDSAKPGAVTPAALATALPAAAADPSLAVSLVPPAIPPQLPPLAGPADAPSPEWRKQNPTVPAPVPNASAPIAGRPPRGLPADPARREDTILDIRRKRFAEQMERMNRRNVERGGVPADAGARPPDRTKPSDRRGTLSSDR
jgi:hypothetical protein